jgi:hypothetical protein
VFLGGLVWAFGSVSQAFDYNFETDFSITTNAESSIWSYRWKDGFTRDGNYALLPFAHPGSEWPYVPSWQRLTNDSYPFIGVSDSGDSIGQSLIHPLGSPDGSAFAVVSWLSPTSGTVNIGLRITDVDPRGDDGVTFYADKGSAAGNLASVTIPEGGDTDLFWIYNVPVSVGDRLNFIIDPNGDYYNDATRMFVDITDQAVPEPSSLALLAFGITMVCFGLLRQKE